MAEWKKVIVSGSSAHLSSLQVGSNQQIGTTQATTFLTGSFTGSFSGNGAGLSGVVASSPNALTAGSGLSAPGTYDGSVARTFTVDSGSLLPYFSSSIFARVTGGDITINSAGVAAIGSGKVTSAMILDATIVGGDIASTTVANSNLVNSSITIGSTSTALGATSTTLAGLTSVTSTTFVGNLTGTATTASSVTVANVSGLAAGVATFLGTPSSVNLLGAVTDETGTGNLVFATNPVLVTPNLGTPTSLTLTSATGLPISTGVSGLGTSVATALAVNVGSAGAFVTNGGALGTPSGGTLTNATGLPISTGVSGLGAGVATFLATPSSANLASALTDETGTAGSVVFSAGPTLTGTTNVAALAASGNVTIAGNLNVSGFISGSATYITSTNVAITDQFILLASGSGAIVDAGIIVQDAAGTGESFYWENNPTGTGRWAIASAVDPTSVTVTAAEYNVTAKTAAGAPSGNPTYGGATNGFGQMYVNVSNSDIWIFA